MYTCKPPFEGQVPQVTQAPEIAKVSPSSISASLRMTGEAICYPSGSRPGWALPPFWWQERKHRVSHIGDRKSKKHRWNEVRRDSRTFLFMVHLVPRLLVPETACGFYSVQVWHSHQQVVFGGKKRKKNKNIRKQCAKCLILVFFESLVPNGPDW